LAVAEWWDEKTKRKAKEISVTTSSTNSNTTGDSSSSEATRGTKRQKRNAGMVISAGDGSNRENCNDSSGQTDGATINAVQAMAAAPSSSWLSSEETNGDRRSNGAKNVAAHRNGQLQVANHSIKIGANEASAPALAPALAPAQALALASKSRRGRKSKSKSGHNISGSNKASAAAETAAVYGRGVQRAELVTTRALAAVDHPYNWEGRLSK
jgi:hypothetical protein